MRILRTRDRNFLKAFAAVVKRSGAVAEDIELTVRDILQEVRTDGDRALIRFTEKFDKIRIRISDLEVSKKQIRDSYKKVSKEQLSSLARAYQRIEKFHRRQMQNSWIQAESEGEIVGQLVRPLQRAGMYVPGGKAVYPSSVLMNAIPARVAGVAEIIMVTPGAKNGINPILLVAADLCGIEKIFQIGGAQAIGALAYGTESVPRVDKIVGPGNIYVATAKRLVYGDVDIDMVAGPSEILIIADSSVIPAYAAADMLSQA
ncbi:MAG: histidinol dehydrogenase, partial [Proteobacteria bacterium]|nr:histidinol dehydrogenase [Pseudomonadota bacterium]